MSSSAARIATAPAAEAAALVDAVEMVRGMPAEQVRLAVLACLAGEAQTFEAALGLPADWRRIRAIELRAQRDGVLRELAERLLPGGRIADQELLVRAELRRYERRWLRRDRYAATPPTEYAGTPDEVLFKAFRLAERIGTDIPAGRTQLRAILTYCRNDDSASAPGSIASDKI